MVIVVAGKNNIAIQTVEWIINNIPNAEIYSIYNGNDSGVDGFQRSYKKFCLERNIKSIELLDAYKIEEAIFLSLEFDKIISPEKFKSRLLFNIHFSLLPKYKGMYTSAWPILNGEVESGVTLHCIDHGIDTGAIIAQEKIILDDNETAKSLYLKYISFGTKLVIENLPSILQGIYDCKEQQAIGSTYYSKKSINYNQLSIDLNQTAQNIFRQIKAFTFRDYQLPKVKNYEIFLGKVLSERSHEKAGNIICDGPRSIILSTIDYNIELYKDNFYQILEAAKDKNGEYISALISNDEILFEKNLFGWSLIIVAAYHGNMELICWLVNKGVDINDRNNNGTTVAMYLKNYMDRSGDFKVMDDLVRLGADLSLRDNNDLSIFDYTELSGNERLINYISSFKNA